jgi:hypothetical protein
MIEMHNDILYKDVFIEKTNKSGLGLAFFTKTAFNREGSRRALCPEKRILWMTDAGDPPGAGPKE